jgi:cell division protein FtsL
MDSDKLFEMRSIPAAISFLLGFALLILSILYARYRRRTTAALSRYSQLINLEEEEARLSAANLRVREEAKGFEQRAAEEHKRLLSQHRDAEAIFLQKEETTRAALAAEYQTALARYQELQKEIAIGEDSLEDLSFGLYKPHFTFQTPDEYKAKIELLRNQQRDVVRDGRAAQCHIAWTVGNSQMEGKRMIRQNSQLMLRAFNGECEAAIANVSWSNSAKMEERVRKAFSAINKLGAVLHISITDLYLMLKVEELRMVQEFEQKRYEIREEQRRIREQIREEERAQKEIDDAIAESTSDEDKYSAAIQKARDEATQAMGAKLEKLTEQIGRFEAKLDEARRRKERAIARAQITKSGFVYIISNIGSFGERVFKIGMTRRMEPMDRIYELSGAAVPFPYDLHAMLYSDDAPGLEHELHSLFKDRRLNRVNARREFFQDVALDEIEGFVRSKGLSAQFLQLPEAREYRQTLALREAVQKTSTLGAKQFPKELFASE